MVGWDWRLRTAASTMCDVDHGRLILTEANSQLVYQSALAATSTVRRSSQQRHLCCSPQYWLVSCQQRHLWQPPILSGGPFIPDIFGASRKVGEGNENLVYPSPWDFKRSFTGRKILRHGTSGFASHPRGRCAEIFIALKNSSPWLGSNPQPLGPVAPPKRKRSAR
jgi:hypothetical protein